MEPSPLQNGDAPYNETVTQLAIVTGVNKGGRPRIYDTDAERQRAFRQKKRSAREAEKLSVHFSSTTDIWETPQSFFDALDTEFHFDTDVCADASNAKCPHYFSPEQDGILQVWRGTCYMNPPYGADIGLWVQKAYDCSLYGVTVVCLLPARVDTRWWHRFVTRATEIRYLKGRLKFGGGENSAPFPSAVVIYKPIG